MKCQHYLAAGICGFVVTSGFADAAEPKAPKKGQTAETAVALTDAGKALEMKYAAMQTAIKAEIEAALPKRDDAKIAAWREALNAEEGPAKEAAATAGAVAKMRAAADKLRQLEEDQQFAPKTLADAKDELQRAKAKGEEDPEKEKVLASAENFLASRQKDLDALQGNIEKARIAVKEAQAGLPAAMKAAEAAKQAHDKAMAATWKAMDALGTSGILGSSQLDGKLARYRVIETATPRGLAEFAEKSPDHEKLIQQLLANEALMVQMLVADGPTGGRFGEAMKIYMDIQKASPRAKEGLFQRLALAVSLAHAAPIKKQVPSADKEEETSGPTAPIVKDGSDFIDPVKRYLSYEKWYLDGELDQGFKDLSVWNLTMVVDGDEPDEIYAWGRQMLRNLRPDCIPHDGDTSVYVDVVDKEIAYTSAMVKDDLPELQFMQNILANGGICGRRAFFGRFTLRAFGLPTTARKQPGHATLAHWHPDGWKTRLGGDWGPGARGFYSAMNSARSNTYGADVNFLASSQAREDATAFMRVKRAQWIGALVGEERKPGLITFSGKTTGPKPKKAGEMEKPIFWNDLALHEQRRVIARLEPEGGKSSGIASVAAKAPAATGKVTIDAKGVITIPSAACSSPTESTRTLYKGGRSDRIVFVNNKSGDTLLHLSRYSKEADTFEYKFDAPKGGKYQLVANVVTPKPNQRLFASANGGADVEMALPYTIGMWDKTAPVAIELKAGRNVLKFHGPARVTLGQLILTPMH
jgi:hypothetical protein